MRISNQPPVVPQHIPADREVVVSGRGCTLIVVGALLLIAAIIGLTIWSVRQTNTAIEPGVGRNRAVARVFIDDTRAGRAPRPQKLTGSTSEALRVLQDSVSYTEQKATGVFGGSYGDELYGMSCFEYDVRGSSGEKRVLVTVDGHSKASTVSGVALVTGDCYCTRYGVARGC